MHNSVQFGAVPQKVESFLMETCQQGPHKVLFHSSNIFKKFRRLRIYSLLAALGALKLYISQIDNSYRKWDAVVLNHCLQWCWKGRAVLIQSNLALLLFWEVPHGIYNLLANICQVLTVLQLWLDAVVEVKVVKVICSVVSGSFALHGL